MHFLGKQKNNTYITIMERRIKKVEYKLIPHAADICIEVGEQTLKKLFDKSASAVTEQMVGIGRINKKIIKSIAITAPDKDLLFIYWLQEILYHFYVHGLMYIGGKINKLSNTEFKAEVVFNRFNPEEHVARREIKAVTYHNIHIKKRGKKYIVKFVIDV